MKIIVAGTRSFNDYNFMKKELNILFAPPVEKPITIVSGGASGADKLGERYAKENNWTIERYPAQWDKFGKKAGILRNEQMAQVADGCVVFWDGKSRGTKNMIENAQKYNLPLVVFRYEGGKEKK